MMAWADKDLLTPANLNDKSGLVFNVKDEDFGAAGDGVADDSSAIQLAIDAAEALGGGVVFLPPGRYLSSGFTLKSGIILRGSGSYDDGTNISNLTGTIIQAVASTTTFIIDAAATSNAVVENLKLIGNSPQSGNSIRGIITSSSASEFLIRDVQARFFGDSVLDIDGGVCRVERLKARACNGHIINWAVSDGHISYCDIGSSNETFADGIRLTDAGGQNALIGNNIFNCRYGINLDNNARTRVIGNRCEKNGFAGIRVNGFFNNITGNQVWNNGSRGGASSSSRVGILVDNRDGNAIVGNEIFNLTSSSNNTQAYGIHLIVGSDNNTIVGNVFDGLHDDDINIAGTSSFNVVCANTHRSNGSIVVAASDCVGNLISNNVRNNVSGVTVEDSGTSTVIAQPSLGSYYINSLITG